ncbi:unnamed protein product [Allacma fusca]|uniref:E3 ubiquitin-protein ligase Sina-like RING finger domain-containing protein n=1 Tax=Allacma fusca TaxID=39272 RepID=A0A8J2P7K0_9HEXA|nr:unnamed protein product [Allacma fusca]
MSDDTTFGSQNDLSGGDLSRVTPRRDLQKILECPVCHLIPSPPIYNCLQGHSICCRCRPKIDKCPLCQAAYTCSRNFALEAIIETSTFVCDHHEEGCLAVLAGKDFQAHVVQCGFRPIICHLGSFHACHGSQVGVKNYLSHLITVHKVQQCERTVGNSFTVAHILRDSNVSDVSWCGKYVEFDGRHFLTRSFLSMGIFHFCLVLLDEDQESSQYTVRIKIEKRDSKNRTFEIKIPVCPIRMSDSLIIEDCLHGMLNKSLLRMLCDVEEKIDDTLKLRWEVHYELMKLS